MNSVNDKICDGLLAVFFKVIDKLSIWRSADEGEIGDNREKGLYRYLIISVS